MMLPPRLKKEVGATTRGLTFTAAVAIIMACLFDLSTVASLGSAASLMVYMLVNLVALKKIDATGSRLLLLQTSVAACLLAITIWVTYTLLNKPQTFLIFLAFLVASVVVKAILQRALNRRIQPTPDLQEKRQRESRISAILKGLAYLTSTDVPLRVSGLDDRQLAITRKLVPATMQRRGHEPSSARR